ncbi:hypothetical protein RF11_06882 [Thelohanellus kitauei]|uniref:Uncharacterized protein n=1 Tax=Thelohanellus kitauei TaxID=669202 RepID=A0A0C2M5B4_THEKT|nr:hypothetical protein RF11_06882 [Thelohanellus kitauei]
MVFDPFIAETRHKSIFLKIEEKMLTQGLNPYNEYQIEDVTEEHDNKTTKYFEVFDKAIKFDILAKNNIKFWSTFDIRIRCNTQTSTKEKIFIVEICADRRLACFIRNIIYHKETSTKCFFVYRIQFSINPYNQIWYSRNPIEVLCNLYYPSIGYVKLATHTMELKKFKMKIYTNTPITELNKSRKIQMEFTNLLPVSLCNLIFKILVECHLYTTQLIFELMPSQTFHWLFITDEKVGSYNS